MVLNVTYHRYLVYPLYNASYHAGIKRLRSPTQSSLIYQVSFQLFHGGSAIGYQTNLYQHNCRSYPLKYTRQISSYPDKSIKKEPTISSIPSSSSSNTWIDTTTWIPDKFRPYLHLARADKQVGTLLLFWPCCWSVALAAPLGNAPDFALMMKFGLGAMIMRSAGCIINDIWDRDFDKHVERTKHRPLTTGAISLYQAVTFLGLQLSAGLAVLLTFNFNSIILGFESMPLVIIYPLMKRYTNFPQLLLGLTFNWGALMGWTAVHGSISLPHCLPLYAAGVCWTLVYDTIYAYQDRKDDLKLGLKSTSLYLGDKPQIPLTIIATSSMISLATAGYVAQLTMPFYIGVAGIGSHLLWQIWTADVNDSKNLWNRFNSNKYVGAAVTAIIVIGHYQPDLSYIYTFI